MAEKSIEVCRGLRRAVCKMAENALGNAGDDGGRHAKWRKRTLGNAGDDGGRHAKWRKVPWGMPGVAAGGMQNGGKCLGECRGWRRAACQKAENALRNAGCGNLLRVVAGS